MGIAGWIRARLWRADDWCAALGRLSEQVAGDASPRGTARAIDLARALELVDPDRQRALDMYMTAWRFGERTAVDDARRLAREVRAPAALAELALADHKKTADPAHLVAAATAWIDGGTPRTAEEPLRRAIEQLPDDPAVRGLLAAVSGELKDAPKVVAYWLELADAGRAEPARAYLLAARIARSAGLADIYPMILRTAFNRGLGGDLMALLEARLVEVGDTNALLDLYRQQLEVTKSDHDWVDWMRAAATRLALAGTQPGLALRLVRRTLEHAYGARHTEIPGHLASWELLVRHAHATQSTIELMPLLVDALALAFSDDERLYLGKVGFEVTWRDARDLEGARPYAGLVAELVPDHPGVCDFMSRELATLFTGAEADAFFAAAMAVVGDEPGRAEIDALPELAVAELVPEPVPAPVPATPPPVPAATPTAPARRRPISMIPLAALDALAGGKRVGVPAAPALRADAAARAARAVVPIDLALRLPGDKVASAVARDISATGLFAMTTAALEVGATIVLDLRLPGPDPLQQLHHVMTARVVRRAVTGYGLAFVDPSAEASATIAALCPGGPLTRR